MTTSTIATVAKLTVREAIRRRLVWSLAGVTLTLLLLSAWAFHALAAESQTSEDAFGAFAADLAVAEILGFFLFAVSMSVALGAAFLTGPVIAGDLESGVLQSLLARPVRRSSVLLGRWLGLSAFTCAYAAVAALGQFAVGYLVTGYAPPGPLTAVVMLAAQGVTLVTLALLLSSLLSSMAASMISAGMFAAAWVAGMVGALGAARDSGTADAIGVFSRMLLPTDGLWRAATHSLRSDGMIADIVASSGMSMLSATPPTPAYLGWAALWTVVVLSLAMVVFSRRDA